MCACVCVCVCACVRGLGGGGGVEWGAHAPAGKRHASTPNAAPWSVRTYLRAQPVATPRSLLQRRVACCNNAKHHATARTRPHPASARSAASASASTAAAAVARTVTSSGRWPSDSARTASGSADGTRWSCEPMQSRRRCGTGEPSPGADVARVSQVPAQMWLGCAESRRGCGRGGTPVRYSSTPSGYSSTPSCAHSLSAQAPAEGPRHTAPRVRLATAGPPLQPPRRARLGWARRGVGRAVGSTHPADGAVECSGRHERAQGRVAGPVGAQRRGRALQRSILARRVATRRNKKRCSAVRRVATRRNKKCCNAAQCAATQRNKIRCNADSGLQRGATSRPQRACRACALRVGCACACAGTVDVCVRARARVHVYVWIREQAK